MRRCDLGQLTLKPFAGGGPVVAVAKDGQPRVVALGGAGMAGDRPTLTLYLPSSWHMPNGELTVNLLSPGRPLHARPAGGEGSEAGLQLEPGASVQAARVADARLVFECRVLGHGEMDGLDGYPHVLVVEVLAAYQRWPRGCAIA